MNGSAHPTSQIAVPSIQSVNDCLAKWSNSAVFQKFQIHEQSLDLLFRELLPTNTILAHIQIKVSLLNDLYSTNIYDTYAVAESIAKLKIDERLREGDLSLIAEVARTNIRGKIRVLYSFASKYCSRHRPDVYPIYDRYVERMLVHFKNNDRFVNFKTIDLKQYQTFVAIIDAFKAHYELHSFSRKQIDTYLWLTGRRHFN